MGAFAALKEDGSVVVWGDKNWGGDARNKQDMLTSVKSIYSTDRAFASLKEDGSVVVWGDPFWGGDAGEKQAELINVRYIGRSSGAFAARKLDETNITWGKQEYFDDAISDMMSYISIGDGSMKRRASWIDEKRDLKRLKLHHFKKKP